MNRPAPQPFSRTRIPFPTLEEKKRVDTIRLTWADLLYTIALFGRYHQRALERLDGRIAEKRRGWLKKGYARAITTTHPGVCPVCVGKIATGTPVLYDGHNVYHQSLRECQMFARRDWTAAIAYDRALLWEQDGRPDGYVITERPEKSDGQRWHDCTGCWGVFQAHELSQQSGLCVACQRARLVK